MIYTDPILAAPAFRAALEPAQRILLLTHINPDGDAIGSLLGAMHVLQALGKTPIPVASSALPDYVHCLPGIEQVHVVTAGSVLPEADLTWMLDTAALDRAGPVFTEHRERLLAQPLIVTDHHATNNGGGGLHLIDPYAASCADLLFRLLAAMEAPITPEAATCLLLGTLTDTQSFQTSNTRAETLRTAAAMIEAGGNLGTVVNAVYFTIPVSTIRLTGQALSAVQEANGLIWAVVTQEMLRSTGAGDAATDDTVTRMQRIAGMRACVLFRERHDGTVKLSLRSVPGINVAAIAQQWGGGGHTQAAGATLQMGLEQAQNEVLPLLRSMLAESPA
jgi:bifunctional oligoribonuclease and PAP phosphatase NrnA